MANIGSITVTTKKSTDARRVESGTIVVPGMVSARHLGGKRVQVTTADIEATEVWCDTSGVAASYEYA